MIVVKTALPLKAVPTAVDTVVGTHVPRPLPYSTPPRLAGLLDLSPVQAGKSFFMSKVGDPFDWDYEPIKGGHDDKLG